MSVTTITVSKRVKKLLENIKGGRTWDEFLEDLVREYYRVRRERLRRLLAEGLEEDFESIRVRRWAREY